MVRELLIFLLITFISLGIISTMLFYSIFVKHSESLVSPFEDNKSLIVKGNYSKINVEKQLGKGSYFFVLNTQNKVVYQSDNSHRYPFNSKQTSLIPKSNIDLDIYISKVQNSKYGECEIIEYRKVNDGTTSLLILDKARNVVFSTIPEIDNQISKIDYQCLIGGNEDFKFLRSSFTGNDSKDYNIIFFNKIDNNDSELRQLLITLAYILTIIIVIFSLSLFLYLRRLNKKVNKPLQLLEEAISKFNIDSNNEYINYKGPREFEIICDKFNLMNDRLNETQNEKQKMIADISHDLKTPITIIQSYAKAVNDGLVAENERNEYLETIYNKSNDLAYLIGLFSDYSKLNRSNYKLELVKKDIINFSRNYLIEKINELEFLGFDLDVEIPNDHFYCDIDEFQLKRVYENIISNTVKYSGEKIKISFKIIKLDKQVSIKIGDNGIGIEKELRDKIFDEFVTSDKARTSGNGSGFGLAIAKKIIDMHNGYIHLIPEDKTDLSVEFEIILSTKE